MSKFKEITKTEKVTSEKMKLLYNELLLMHSDNYIKQNEGQCCKVMEIIIEYILYGDMNDQSIFE